MKNLGLPKLWLLIAASAATASCGGEGNTDVSPAVGPAVDAAADAVTDSPTQDGSDGCKPITCQESGRSCGPLPDGCGTMLQCGECTAPLICSDLGACGCPDTCDTLDKHCGQQPTNCSTTIDCGACELGYACDVGEGACKTKAVVMVPMDDGTKLWTQVYLPLPVIASPLGTVLYRTPYRSPDFQFFFDDQAAFYNHHGYAFVLQDVRGTHGSEGDFYIMKNEVADGQATVNWIASQPWSNGKIATLGSSYDGFTALAAAVDNPRVALVLADDPSGGIYYWLRKGVVSMGVVSYYWGDVDTTRNNELLIQTTNALDLSTLDQAVAGRTVAVWQDLLQHPTPDDAFWDPMRLEPVISRVCAPTYFANSTGIGWDDPARLAKIMREQGCAEHKQDVRLVVGNFAHGEIMTSVAYGATTQGSGLFLDYLDKYMGDESIDLSAVPAVQYYATGDTVAHESAEWPPAAAEHDVWYLHGTGTDLGSLSLSAPTDSEAPSHITIDPENSDPCSDTDTPFMAFLGPSVTQGTFVAGSPVLTLNVSGSASDMDLFVSLLDYDPAAPSDEAVAAVTWGMARGRYRNGYDAPSAIPSEEPFEVTITLPPTTWRFLPNHIVLLVAQGSLCSMIENPHTGEPVDQQTHYLPSIHSIYTDVSHPSRLDLPVVERDTKRFALGGEVKVSREAIRRALQRQTQSWMHRGLMGWGK